LVPICFVTSGLRFDLNALLDQPSTLLKVPLFLAALLVVRALPAIAAAFIAAGLLSALVFPVVALAVVRGHSSTVERTTSTEPQRVR
jgi:Kef-type K+ transport system membrane component KefB